MAAFWIDVCAFLVRVVERVCEGRREYYWKAQNSIVVLNGKEDRNVVVFFLSFSISVWPDTCNDSLPFLTHRNRTNVCCGLHLKFFFDRLLRRYIIAFSLLSTF